MQTGNLLFLTGMLPTEGREAKFTGRVGAEIDVETGRKAAYLAALPKAPTTLHPFRQRERAVERRNYVIDRMVENGYANREDGERAKKTPLNVTPRPTGPGQATLPSAAP